MSFLSARLDRRQLLMLGRSAAVSAVSAAGVLGKKKLSNFVLLRREERIPPPFTLGVASGDPTPDGVVMWTRLAPEPLEEDGGMPRRDVFVEWQVAEDPEFRSVVRSGTRRVYADEAHSVHIDVHGLSPASWYWYRFRHGEHLSPVGRTRTAPALDASPDRLTFAFASCQHYEHGYYTPQRHLADEPLDLVVFLGDYIYEASSPTGAGTVRRHVGEIAVSLADYRRRYAQYKSDPDLQAAHAAFPWVHTWDDHEVANDYAGEQAARDPGLRERVTDAYQAFYEHLPIRAATSLTGTTLRLFRRLAFGDLLTLNVLDTRQYRSQEACGPGWRPDCPQEFDPRRTIIGDEQEQWLFDGLSRSRARWNVLANSVLMTSLTQPAPQRPHDADTWDGYPASRQRLLNFLAERMPSNPVVITGDIHFSLAAELKVAARDPTSPTIGSEFVGTSLTSDGDGAEMTPLGPQLLSANPHVRFANGQRGYVRCEVTPRTWRTDYRVVPYVTRRGGRVTTVRSFTIEDGQAGFSPT